jgi:hypothetical protein
MTEQMSPDDVFIFPRKEDHMVGVTAGIFPGHRYAYQFPKSSMSSFSETCWAFWGNTRMEYEDLSDIQGSGAWLIVSENGFESDFVMPPDARAQWSGLFGWGFYKFNLYRIGFPAAFANSPEQM